MFEENAKIHLHNQTFCISIEVVARLQAVLIPLFSWL